MGREEGGRFRMGNTCMPVVDSLQYLAEPIQYCKVKKKKKKRTKIKHIEQILNATREKQQITHNGIPIRLTAYFSTETLLARMEWPDIVKVIKGKKINKTTTKITLFSKNLIHIQRRNQNLYR